MATSSASSRAGSVFDNLDSITAASNSSSDSASIVSQNNSAKQDLTTPSVPLGDYIPIGTIPIQLAIDGDSDPDTDWKEITDFLPQGDLQPNVFQAVVKLWKNLWIRIQQKRCSERRPEVVWRVYILPDDVARGMIDRENRTLRKCVDTLLQHIDVSPEKWDGNSSPCQTKPFDVWASSERYSLFYLFNTLPSPLPDPTSIPDRYSRTAVDDLLTGKKDLWGLKSTLYSYQRRAAATMIQHEVAPKRQLDPRLELRRSPEGREFYYSGRDRMFFQEAKAYDTVRGGILAETMGLGKTIICIVLILTTKGHLPRVPPQYTTRASTRPRVGTLRDMAAGIITRNSTIPWRQVFDGIRIESGDQMDECIKVMEKQKPEYEIPPRQVRSNRSNEFYGPPETVRLSGATIVVVPRNLVQQWQSELAKHLEEGSLKVYVNDDIKMPIPAASDLLDFDIILLSRQRFEYEFKTTDEIYDSPLKSPHWLRIIIDEGHGFSSATSHAATAAERHIRAERRWIVSGTPAKDLLGVEVETMTESEDPMSRWNSLEQRKYFDKAQEDNSGAVKALGTLASRFLKVQPWCSSLLDTNEAPANWDEYVYRHEEFRLRTYTSFSTCLRRTLESLVIKTQPEDVERDLTLPPLTHDIVRLQPSVLDKFTANLFILVFTSNAITSERTDMDYLFHKSSQAHLQRLINNLRQSGFIWTGFKEKHIEEAIKVTGKYLAKETAKASPDDRALLIKTADAAQVVLSSPVWKALGRTKEVGVFVSNFPEDHIEAWALKDCHNPTIVGLQQLRHAQKHVNARLSSEDPLEEFYTAGVIANVAVEQAEKDSEKDEKNSDETPTMVRIGVPTSSLNDDMSSRRLPVAGVTVQTSPKKASPRKTSKSDEASPTSPIAPIKQEDESERPSKYRMSLPQDTGIELAPAQPLADTQITGTTSAKASYLISRIQTLHTDEKILVFYDGNNIAYYISEALDLLHIKHLIYANTLTGEQRSKYIVLFNDDPTQRVLLMDIKQAAHGLNLSSASRVFFVNPPCRPNIEAQAIKRAHRIGQTRPVHVETLILKGTIEEAMHDRAANMTRGEHLKAKNLEEDEGIRGILQQAKILHVSDDELKDQWRQMAPLQAPEQVFGRKARLGPGSSLEEELFGNTRPAKKRRMVTESGKTGTRKKSKKHTREEDASGAVASGVGDAEDTNINGNGHSNGVGGSYIIASASTTTGGSSGATGANTGVNAAAGYVSIFGGPP